MEEPDASIVSDATPDISSAPPSNDAEENTGEREVAPTKPKRHRGRQAKDRLGQSIQFKCNRREDLEQQLRDYLANPTGDPAHTTLEFSFPVTAAFSVPVREPKGTRPLHERTPYVYSLFNKTAVTVIDALQNIQDPREQMLTQKAIAKSIVEAVMEADGYHYSFHNNWLSREDQANRFSYFCNDSMLNKCRAVNGGAKIKEGVKIRKQIWECEGGLSVKFSLTKMSLELHYKHIPLHPTFEERAPPPRNGSKRRKLMEIFHPEKLPQPKRKGRPKQSTPPPRQGPKRRVGRPSGRPWKHLVTEPLPRPMSNTTPISTREDSLQPLFDFLGSAEEAVTATADSVGDGVEPTVESEPPTNGADGAENNGGAAATLGSSRRPQLPGMMSGYMSGEQITWGHKKRGPYKKRKDKRALGEASRTTSSPSLQAPAASEPPSELEALKARLLEAEQKIKDLEAEKNKAGAPLTWNTPPLPPPQPPRPNNVPAYLPPQYHYPPPQPPPRQWHDPRLPHPGMLPSPGPFPQPTPMQHPGPDSMPHTPSPNPTVHENLPHYGFVPNLYKARPGDKHKLPIILQCRVNINTHLNLHRTFHIHKFQFGISIQSSGQAFLTLKTSVDIRTQDSNRLLCSHRLLLNSSMQSHRRTTLKTSIQLRRILLLNHNTRNDRRDLSNPNPSTWLSGCQMPENRGFLAKRLIQLLTRPKLQSRKTPVASK
ncbi:hypothetical protein LTR67_001156 [Exophiala xenobiotica]